MSGEAQNFQSPKMAREMNGCRQREIDLSHVSAKEPALCDDFLGHVRVLPSVEWILNRYVTVSNFVKIWAVSFNTLDFASIFR
jgi:hypothetical protein